MDSPPVSPLFNPSNTSYPPSASGTEYKFLGLSPYAILEPTNPTYYNAAFKGRINQDYIQAYLAKKPPGSYIICQPAANLYNKSIYYINKDGKLQQLQFIYDFKNSEFKQTYPKSNKTFKHFNDILNNPEFTTFLTNPVNYTISQIHPKTTKQLKEQGANYRFDYQRTLEIFGITSQDKEAFFLDCTQEHQEQLTKMTKLCTRVPVFGRMSAAIRANYNKWEELKDNPNTNQLEFLQRKIRQQLENLSVLSNLLSNDDLSDHLALLKDLKLDNELSPFLDGTARITDKEYENISASIDNHYQAMATEESLRPNLKPKRPTSAKSIELASKLFEDSLRSMHYVKGVKIVQPIKNHNHEVYKLLEPDVSAQMAKPISYLKLDDPGVHSSIMEKIVWDAALIFGMEEFFAPTKIWKFAGELNSVNKTDPAVIHFSSEDKPKNLQAGFQSNQEGTLLKVMVDEAKGPDEPYVQRANLINAVLVSLILGMQDAHSENIIITDEGCVKYFDNARSLMHASECIQLGFLLKSVYRTGLFTLNQSYNILTPSEIQQLKEKLRHFESQVSEFDKYLKLPSTRMQIEQLPPGWFITDDVISAMNQRFENLKKALEMSKPINLIDLAGYTHPSFKFDAALLLLKKLPHPPFAYAPDVLRKTPLIELQKKILLWTCYYDLAFMMPLCVNNGIDPLKLYEDCKNLSMDEITSKIVSRLITPIPITAEERMSFRSNGNLLLEIFRSRSKFDMKDYYKELQDKFMEKYIPQTLKQMGIIVNESDPPKQPPNLAPNQIIIYHNSKHPQDTQMWIKRGMDSPIKLGLDCQSVIGKIIVKFCNGTLPPMTAQELDKWVNPTDLGLDNVRTIEQVLYNHFSEKFTVPIEALGLKEALTKARQMKMGTSFIAQYKDQPEGEFVLFTKTIDGKVHKYALDHQTVPGQFAIKIKGGCLPAMEPYEIKKFAQPDVLHFVSEKSYKEVFANHTKGWFLRLDENDDKKVILSFKNQGAIDNDSFDLLKPFMLHKEGMDLTLEQISADMRQIDCEPITRTLIEDENLAYNLKTLAKSKMKIVLVNGKQDIKIKAAQIPPHTFFVTEDISESPAKLIIYYKSLFGTLTGSKLPEEKFDFKPMEPEFYLTLVTDEDLQPILNDNPGKWIVVQDKKNSSQVAIVFKDSKTSKIVEILLALHHESESFIDFTGRFSEPGTHLNMTQIKESMSTKFNSEVYKPS